MEKVIVFREETDQVILYRMAPDAPMPFRSFGLPSSPEDEKEVIRKAFGLAPGQLKVLDLKEELAISEGEQPEVPEEQPEVPEEQPESPTKSRKKKQ